MQNQVVKMSLFVFITIIYFLCLCFWSDEDDDAAAAADGDDVYHEISACVQHLRALNYQAMNRAYNSKNNITL